MASYLLPQLQNIASGKPANPSTYKPSTLGQFYQDTGIAGPQNGVQQGQAQLKSATSSQQSSGGGSNYQDQWNSLGRAGTVPTGWHGESSNSSQPSLPNLDDLYAPIFSSYDATQAALEGGKTSSLGEAQSSYDRNSGLIPGYEQSLRGTLNTNKQEYATQQDSALGQALRAYDLAKKSAQARYGAGGAGDFMTDIAGQTYGQNVGQVGQLGLKANQQFATQDQDIGNWVQQKHVDLDNWLGEAKQSINDNFQQQLFSLNNNRNATTAQKAAGKLQLLESVMNQNSALAQADNNYRNQLKLLQAQSASKLGTNDFNQQTFLDALSGIQSQLGESVNPANQALAVSGLNQNSGQYASLPTNKDNQDYLSQLTGLLQ